MPKQSAGLLMYRWSGEVLEVLLVHPGGPFWAKKDDAWSIPKGEYENDEEPLAAARREFQEETSFTAEGDFIALAPIRQRSGKVVKVWAFQGDCDPSRMQSNLFEMEWPPKSGRVHEFPEADRAGWFSIEAAREKLLEGQRGFLDTLVDELTRRRALL